MTPVLAPGGWGFRPGYPLAGDATLPDLPQLARLSGRERNDAITDALSAFPMIHLVRVRDLKSKYGLPTATASAVLSRAKSP